MATLVTRDGIGACLAALLRATAVIARRAAGLHVPARLPTLSRDWVRRQEQESAKHDVA